MNTYYKKARNLFSKVEGYTNNVCRRKPMFSIDTYKLSLLKILLFLRSFLDMVSGFVFPRVAALYCVRSEVFFFFALSCYTRQWSKFAFFRFPCSDRRKNDRTTRSLREDMSTICIVWKIYVPTVISSIRALYIQPESTTHVADRQYRILQF